MNKNPELRPQSINLFSQEFESKFEAEGKIYKRKIELIKGARQVCEQETIDTVLKDGTLESSQDAKPGDWIITGSKGEEFVFTNEKFHELYKSGHGGSWIPNERKIIVIPNPTMMPVRTEAPWGGFQDGSEKAMFVAEVDSYGKMAGDRYFIGDMDLLLNNYEEETK